MLSLPQYPRISQFFISHTIYYILKYTPNRESSDNPRHSKSTIRMKGFNKDYFDIILTELLY